MTLIRYKARIRTIVVLADGTKLYRIKSREGEDEGAIKNIDGSVEQISIGHAAFVEAEDAEATVGGMKNIHMTKEQIDDFDTVMDSVGLDYTEAKERVGLDIADSARSL